MNKEEIKNEIRNILNNELDIMIEKKMMDKSFKVYGKSAKLIKEFFMKQIN